MLILEARQYTIILKPDWSGYLTPHHQRPQLQELLGGCWQMLERLQWRQQWTSGCAIEKLTTPGRVTSFVIHDLETLRQLFGGCRALERDDYE
jgi:hypothetical protein